MTAPVYLSRVGSSLGDPCRPGNDVPDLVRDSGVETYRVSSSSVAELGAEAIEAALPERPDIDLLVIATQQPTTEQTWQLMTLVRMPDVPAVAVTGDACANLVPALRLAYGTLAAGQSRAVVLVTADRVTEENRYREFGSTLLSDGAAACLLTSYFPGPCFRILGFATEVNAALDRRSTRTAGARALSAGVRTAVRRVTQDIGDSDFSLVLTPHYSRDTREFLATAAGVAEDLVYAPRAADAGHCFSADLLLGLAEAAHDGLTHHERVLLLTTSERSWSAVALEYVVQP